MSSQLGTMADQQQTQETKLKALAADVSQARVDLKQLEAVLTEVSR